VRRLFKGYGFGHDGMIMMNDDGMIMMYEFMNEEHRWLQCYCRKLKMFRR
jgi:hypothetical protein